MLRRKAVIESPCWLWILKIDVKIDKRKVPQEELSRANVCRAPNAERRKELVAAVGAAA